jgi:hypothetical protein
MAEACNSFRLMERSGGGGGSSLLSGKFDGRVCTGG